MQAKVKTAPQLGGRGEGNTPPKSGNPWNGKLAEGRACPRRQNRGWRLGGPFSRLRLCRTLASVDTLPLLAQNAGRVPRIRTPGKSRLSSPTHQDAGKARSAGCKQHAAKSEESATRCDRMSSKEKTRTNTSRGSGQGEGKKGTCTLRRVRWSNAPFPAPRKQSLKLKSTFSMPIRKESKGSREAERLQRRRGNHLEMPAGRRNCRPKSHPRRNLEREGGRLSAKLKSPRVLRNLATPDEQSSP